MTSIKNKRIEEFTMEEWGEFFPIEMISPRKEWPSIFRKEKELILKTLTSSIVKSIEHIGSTAIPNLASKGSIDMLIDISNELLFDSSIVEKMETIGYEYCIQGGFGQEYMIFAKGFNRDGKKEQQYFVHMTPKSHTELWDRIYFRDFLIAHPEVAIEYENLKMKLTAKFSKHRRNFRIGKTDFVMKITELAKQENDQQNNYPLKK
ncbi:GrpB family protein [uncultured Aquimarina sp.]|uniref:GrpB family protein n=1 Tax=uncultured Aquimarina sp. TaxID=575652 RepID=UPI00261DE96A|nr:GrpB family protein [uncultured Aquimarina sp.]